MLEVSQRNFGLLIAYIVPGVIALWGLSFVVSGLRPWLLGISSEPQTVGGFLYLILGGVTFGMLASVVRWVLIDGLHHVTGVVRPDWTDEFLHERLSGYNWIVENHYRYYQFYANSLIAIVFAYALWRGSLPEPLSGFGWIDASIVVLAGMLLAGSRNALSRYYKRATRLLGGAMEDPMTNGGHHPDKPSAPKGPPVKAPDTKSNAAKAGTTRPSDSKTHPKP